MTYAIPTDFPTLLGQMKDDIDKLKRRPSPMSAADLLGPGTASLAIRVDDLNDQTFNGNFYALPGARHTPDPTKTWTGNVIAKDNGSGMQQFWNTDDLENVQYRMRTYIPAGVSGYTWSEWKSFATPTGYVQFEHLDPAWTTSLQDTLDDIAEGMEFILPALHIYTQDTAPANPELGRALQVGDQWFDTNDDNKAYIWDGTAWIDYAAYVLGDIQTELSAAQGAAESAASAAADAMDFAVGVNAELTLSQADIAALEGKFPIMPVDVGFDIGGSNQIRNGGFERTDIAIDALMSGGGLAYAIGNGLSVYEYSTTHFRSGTRGIKLAATDPPATPDDVFWVIPEGTPYYLPRAGVETTESVWVYLTVGGSVNATGMLLIIYDGTPGPGYQIASAYADPTVLNEWQRVSVTYTPYDHTVGVERRLRIGQGATAWYDEWMAESGGVATAWAPHVSELEAGSVKTVTIADDSITAPKLVAESVVAGKIAADAVGAYEIAAEAITAAELAAGAVTANKLSVIMGGGNFAPNSVFRVDSNSDGVGDSWTKASSVGSTTGTRITGIGVNEFAQQITTTGLTSSGYAFLQFAATPFVPIDGKATLSAYINGTLVSGQRLNMNVSFYNTAGSGLGDMSYYIASADVSSAFVRFVSTMTSIPATTAQVIVRFYVEGNGVAGDSTFAITRVQLEAGDVVTAWAPKPDEILPGTISAAMIQATAIDAMTITGATVRTSSSATTDGVIFDASGIAAYDGGVPKFTVDAATGTMTTVGGILSGGTITGPVFQTHEEEFLGLKITASGLVSYLPDESGDYSFAIDFLTGSIYADGTFAGTDLDFYGATVTGGTIQTSQTANTGIKMNNAGLVGYDGTSAKFTLDAATGNVTLAGTMTGGGTITGPKFRTAEFGQRIEIGGGIFNEMLYYTGSAEEAYPGLLSIDDATGMGLDTLYMTLYSPSALDDTSTIRNANLQFTVNKNQTTDVVDTHAMIVADFVTFYGGSVVADGVFRATGDIETDGTLKLSQAAADHVVTGMQRGNNVVATNASGEYAFTFPQAFPSGYVPVVVATGGNLEFVHVIPNPTNTGFTARFYDPATMTVKASAGVRIYYIAM